MGVWDNQKVLLGNKSQHFFTQWATRASGYIYVSKLKVLVSSKCIVYEIKSKNQWYIVYEIKESMVMKYFQTLSSVKAWQSLDICQMKNIKE